MPYSIQTGRNLPDVCDPKNVCCLSSLMSLSAPRILYQPKKSKLKKSYVNNVWPLRQKRSECLTIFTCKAVHQPFERTGMPFERLQLTVLKNSSSVRTVRAMRSTKLISRSNGSSYPFEKIHQPFERLELSVRENSSAVWTARAIRSRKFISRLNGLSYPFKKETVSYFGSRSKKTRRDDFKTINSPFFVKWRSHHVYVVVNFLSQLILFSN